MYTWSNMECDTLWSTSKSRYADDAIKWDNGKSFTYYTPDFVVENALEITLREICLAVNIEKVIFNDPATIILWDDGTKTVVKAHNEPFDKEKGLAMAIAKRALGNRGNYFNVFKKYCEE